MSLSQIVADSISKAIEEYARYANNNDDLQNGRAAIIAPSSIRIAVAVSGGMDSITLSDILLCLPYKLRISLLHYDHGLQSSSDRAKCAAMLRSWAARNNLPLHIGRSSPGAIEHLAKMKGIGIEAAAREMRYRFFEQMSRRLGIRLICVAHTMDDQVETALMRMIQGSGVAGLGGMDERSWRARGGGYRYMIARPLLTAPRSAIGEWFERRNLQCHYDKSNNDTRFLRNRIRKMVIPALRKAYPSYRFGVVQSAKLCSAADAFIAEQSEHALQWQTTPEGYVASRDSFFNAASLARERSLYRLINCRRRDLTRIPRRFISLALADDRQLSCYTIASGYGIEIIARQKEVILNVLLASNDTIHYAKVISNRFINAGGQVALEIGDGVGVLFQRVVPPLLLHGVASSKYRNKWSLEDRRSILASGSLGCSKPMISYVSGRCGEIPDGWQGVRYSFNNYVPKRRNDKGSKERNDRE